MQNIYILCIVIIGKRNAMEDILERNISGRREMHKEAMGKQDEMLQLLAQFLKKSNEE